MTEPAEPLKALEVLDGGEITARLETWMGTAGLSLMQDWTNRRGDTLWSCTFCSCTHLVTSDWIWEGYETANVSSELYRNRMTLAAAPCLRQCSCHRLPERMSAFLPRIVFVLPAGSPTVSADRWWASPMPHLSPGEPATVCSCGEEPLAFVNLPQPEDVFDPWADEPNDPVSHWYCAACLGVDPAFDVAAMTWLYVEDPAVEPGRVSEVRDGLEAMLALGWLPSRKRT